MTRRTVFITHAAPEDNEFALWLASKLALFGYAVWIDRRRLLGGNDFWSEIDRVLRQQSVKQIVLFSEHVSKEGVKRELAIGSIVSNQLRDPDFMVPVRIGPVEFANAPPEFVRGNILNAYPNWHDGLSDLLETLEKQGVPRSPTPDSETLLTILKVRQEHRSSVRDIPEDCLTNWFPVIKPPEKVYYYRFEGLQEHMKEWLRGCAEPYVTQGRLVGTFAAPIAFVSSRNEMKPPLLAYESYFLEFVSGHSIGPYEEAREEGRRLATNDVVSLLRQHFDLLCIAAGLKKVEFANKQIGWFFPDSLVAGQSVKFLDHRGIQRRRVMSGKFKALRWHVCLIAKPRIWPQLVYRVHINVVLSDNGEHPLPGEKTHLKRRRLTRSWWNHIWRDRLLGAMHFVVGVRGGLMDDASVTLEVASIPLTVEVPKSYSADDVQQPLEEDEFGTIIENPALDGPEDHFDELDEVVAGSES